MEDIYPTGPQGVPPALTQPSAIYKRRAWAAVASLGLFVAVYVALAGWFVWTAYRVLGEAVAGGPQAFYHYIIGFSAALLAVFMLKALFFIQRGAAPDALEVTAADQPRLFGFLHRLADAAGAPRPHRVYLSPRVNAAVFFDFSIANLLFPSRKNLEIGLALVNVLSLSELKAVLAHEFGHFAQRSMAIGSWVYIAQQIATQVVAKRDAMDKALQFLSRTDFRVAWIGWLLSLVVWSIRSLMDTLLRLVVLAQRSLSRQMEFQADLVAVSLTGSDELVHALHKLQAADEAWGRTLGFADSELRQGRAPHELFAVQTRIIEKMALILGDEAYGRIPRPTTVDPRTHRVFKTAFAQPPQMWATHPANADREENAKRLYLAAPHDGRSAWLLFDDAEEVKARTLARMLGDRQVERSAPEQTFMALDESYALLQFDPRYRGAYLGRTLARHAARPEEMYDAALADPDVRKALEGLYSAALAEDLARLRSLEEERGTLQALHDRVYQATGGRIVHRGREISRRQLAEAIREVAQEEGEARQRVLAHDRRCRGAHLAAAHSLGGGWRDYLAGLIAALHYAEHTLADLRDAQGLLGNVFAVVTADGKVSSGEVKRLVAAANTLYEALARVFRCKAEVELDASLCARLRITAWAETLEEFKLPPASRENISDWLKAVDGWVESAAGPLASLRSAALEQLLLSEDEVARRVRESAAASEAPAPSRLPQAYPTLLPGQERKRQTRLGLWDRFVTADGLAPAVGRLLAAGAIVGAVLGFGSVVGTSAVLSIYNGLGRTVTVTAGNRHVVVAPFSAEHLDVELNEHTRIEASADDGRTIERFTPPLGGHAQHYVYNVAGASPLVEWTATYGSAQEQPPRALGAPRWLSSAADVFFSEPPKSVQTKSGGATRLVLTGLGNRSPSDTLKLLENEDERRQVILAHAKWDADKVANAASWRAIAVARFGEPSGR